MLGYTGCYLLNGAGVLKLSVGMDEYRQVSEGHPVLLLPLVSFMTFVSRKLTKLMETSCVNLGLVFPLRYSMKGVRRINVSIPD